MKLVEYTKNGSQVYPTNVSFYTPHSFNGSKAGYFENSSKVLVNKSFLFNAGKALNLTLAAIPTPPATSGGVTSGGGVSTGGGGFVGGGGVSTGGGVVVSAPKPAVGEEVISKPVEAVNEQLEN